MIKFTTLVNDETGEKFKEYCSQNGVSAYRWLSVLIHKAVGTQPPSENRAGAVLLALHRKQKALQKDCGGSARGDQQKSCGKCGRPYGDCSHTSTD